MNVVDTSGWLEFFFDGPKAKVFTPILDDTSRLLVPVICLYEVFKKVCAAAGEARALQTVAQMKLGRVLDVTEPVALRAASISLQHGLPMADSLILAFAWTHEAKLWTMDQHFAGLPGVEFTQTTTEAPRPKRAPRH